MKVHEAPEPLDLEEGSRPEPRTTDADAPTIVPFDLMVVLALTSLAAAGLHFAVLREHAAEANSIGIAFAVMSWMQALWAVGVLTSSDRRWLTAGLVGNSVVIAVWALSRTTGLPFGPATEREAVGRIDLLATVLEALIVLGCAAAIAGRGRGSVLRGRRWPLALYGLSLALITSAALITAGTHTHAGASHDHAEAERVLVGGPASTTHSGPLHVHIAGTEIHADGHDHGGGAVAGVADPEQLEQIRTAMQRYADVGSARAEGFIRMDDDSPETGAHFGIEEWTEGGAYSITGDLDLANPEYLMYTKRLTGSWQLVAVAYVADMWEYPEPPTALVGAPYHEHVWNCIEPEGWTLDEEEFGYVSQEECEDMGNTWSPGGEWMTHVWLIPNPEGVFADWNPNLA